MVEGWHTKRACTYYSSDNGIASLMSDGSFMCSLITNYDVGVCVCNFQLLLINKIWINENVNLTMYIFTRWNVWENLIKVEIYYFMALRNLVSVQKW